jgi:hypothetical protein
MANFEDFIPEVLPYVSPACPDSLVIDFLRAGSIEFCEKSKAFVRDYIPVRSTASLTGPFAFTDGSSTLTVTHASHGALVGDFVTFDSVASAVGGIAASDLTAQFQIVTVPDTNTFTITAPSNASGTGSSAGGAITLTHQTSINTVGGTFEYTIPTPSDTEVYEILWMTHDGDDLDPISPISLELNYPDWRDRNGIPQVFLRKTTTSFYAVPVPNTELTKSSGFIFSVALKPTRTSTTIQDAFSSDYRDGIIYGAVYRLLRMPNREWSDPAAAADYRGLFEEEVKQAELRARGGNTGVKRIVKYKGAGLTPRERYRKYGQEIDY